MLVGGAYEEDPYEDDACEDDESSAHCWVTCYSTAAHGCTRAAQMHILRVLEVAAILFRTGVVCGQFFALTQLAFCNTLAYERARQKSCVFRLLRVQRILHTFSETSDWVRCRPSLTQPTRSHETAWQSPLPKNGGPPPSTSLW